MKRVVWIVFSLAVCIFSAHAERRVALVIGNATYADAPLKNPVNDARDMRERLKGLGFVDANIVYRENLKTGEIGALLREWRAKLTAGGDTVGLVFYAGHGVQIRGENYLPTVDARIEGEEDVPRQAVKLAEVMTVMAESRTRLNLVFLDACRNNPYARSFRDGTRGLAPERLPSGTLIAYATRPGAVAADGSGRNGVFTAQLLSHMATPGLTVDQVIRRVVRGVRAGTDSKQDPWTEGSIDEDFYLAQRAPEPPPPPVGPRVGEVIKDCTDCPELVLLPTGRFVMGSPDGEKSRDSDEGPTRTVTIGYTLAVGRTEVTAAQYLKCVAERGCDEPEWREKGNSYHYQTGSDDYYRKFGAALTGDSHPIIGVNWNNAQQYVKWLNGKVSGKGFRLLSEAEWEYAARAGSAAAYSFGDSDAILGDYAWFSGNSNGKPQPVAQKKPNAYGLHDMHGNVWEWVEDVWHDNYSGAPTDGSAWKTGGDSARRVLRGGSWVSGPRVLRSANRLRFTPDNRVDNTGFRIARTF